MDKLSNADCGRFSICYTSLSGDGRPFSFAKLMLRYTQYLFIAFLLTLITGCTLFNTDAHNKAVYRQNPASPPGGANIISIDAKQRVIMEKNTGEGKRIYCAEPSPDALSATASSLSGASTDAGISVAQTIVEAAANIGLRTQTIQLLRDEMYRVCEGYWNGAFDRDSVIEMHQRFHYLTVGLLAIEQLTGVAQPADIHVRPMLPSKTPAITVAKTLAITVAKTPAETAAKTPAITVAKTLAEMLAKMLAETAAKTPAITRAEMLAKTLAETLAETPAKTPAITAAKTLAEMLAKMLAETAAKTPAITPAKTLAETLAKTLAETLAITRAETPAKTLAPVIVQTNTLTPEVANALGKHVAAITHQTFEALRLSGTTLDVSSCRKGFESTKKPEVIYGDRLKIGTCEFWLNRIYAPHWRATVDSCYPKVSDLKRVLDFDWEKDKNYKGSCEEKEGEAIDKLKKILDQEEIIPCAINDKSGSGNLYGDCTIGNEKLTDKLQTNEFQSLNLWKWKGMPSPSTTKN